MYEFSRALYRALADEIVDDEHEARHRANHERVLRACEAAMERLANDRQYFARPSRALFREVRVYFPIACQARVLRTIEAYLAVADEFVRRSVQHGLDANGEPLQCRASTRKGTPCQRVPVTANGYCPSHQHLAETEQVPATLAA